MLGELGRDLENVSGAGGKRGEEGGASASPAHWGERKGTPPTV